MAEQASFKARENATPSMRHIDASRRVELYREVHGYPKSKYSQWLAQCLSEIKNGLVDMQSPLQGHTVECMFEVTRTEVRICCVFDLKPIARREFRTYFPQFRVTAATEHENEGEELKAAYDELLTPALKPKYLRGPPTANHPLGVLFGQPMIETMICVSWFPDADGVGIMCRSLFEVDDTGLLALEVIACAATMVRLALDDWKEGKYKPVKLETKTYKPIYNFHLNTLLAWEQYEPTAPSLRSLQERLWKAAIKHAKLPSTTGGLMRRDGDETVPYCSGADFADE